MVLSSKTLGDFVKEQLARDEDEQNKANPALPVSDKNDNLNTPTNAVKVEGPAINVNNAATNSNVNNDLSEADKWAVAGAEFTPESKQHLNSPELNNISPVSSLATVDDSIVRDVQDGKIPISDSHGVNLPEKQDLATRMMSAPDLDSIIQMINEDVELKKEQAEKAKQLSAIPILADLGLLVGDYIGAKNNARVDKREATTGKYNNLTDQLNNLYKESKAKRPERIAQLLMQDFKNRLSINNYNLSEEKQRQQFERDKERLAQNAAKIAFDMRYKEALIEGKSKDAARKDAELAQRKAYQEATQKERTRHNKAMEGISGMNAQSGRMRADAYVEKTKNGGVGKSTRSIPLFFKDGTEINIPDAVWKANYPVLIDILTNSGAPTPFGWSVKSPTASQAEYFIKQNKDKLPAEARTWLDEISKMNPSEYGVTSDVGDGEVDKWSEYEE